MKTRTGNPYVNAGAIATTSLIVDSLPGGINAIRSRGDASSEQLTGVRRVAGIPALKSFRDNLVGTLLLLIKSCPCKGEELHIAGQIVQSPQLLPSK
jgi:hypothetical protein